MLTLSDINKLTNSNDGSIYSDMYKSVYGFRPRGHEFKDLKEFDFEMMCLSNQFSIHLDEDRARKAARWDSFLARIEQTKQLISNIDTRRAAEIIAEAEGIETDELKFYGWEVLEHELGLNYNSIKTFLEENN